MVDPGCIKTSKVKRRNPEEWNILANIKGLGSVRQVKEPDDNGVKCGEATFSDIFSKSSGKQHKISCLSAVKRSN